MRERPKRCCTRGPEPVADFLGRVSVALLGRLGIDAEYDLLAVAEAGLRRLDVDAFVDERGRSRMSEVVKMQVRESGLLGRRHPDASPVAVVQRRALGGHEDVGIRVGAGDAAPREVLGEHGHHPVGDGEGPKPSPALGVLLDHRSLLAPGALLGNRDRVTQEVDAADPQPGDLPSSEPEWGQVDDGIVGHWGGQALEVLPIEDPRSARRSLRNPDVAARSPDDELGGLGERKDGP